ncbi:FUSC family protein [Micromonosporaceae bacterium Da 78-11]
MTDAGKPGRLAVALTELPGRSRSGFAGGVCRVRGGLALALQAGVAAGLAWLIAHDLIGRPTPFFAPIAAVITLASSVGQRLRRTTELVVGVAIGIGIGDAIILLIGTGPWQIGLVVVLAILVATAVGGGTPLVVQSASSAVLVATLTSNTGLPWTRFFDALVGGGVGLTVMTVLLPLNPLTVVRRAADPALQALTDGLHQVAAALAEGDREAIEEALAKLRAAEGTFAAFSAAVTAARENVAFAPARWHNRGSLAQYVDGADQVTYALRNVRVLVRRLLTALGDEEKIPAVLPVSIGLLGDAVELLKTGVGQGRRTTRRPGAGTERRRGVRQGVRRGRRLLRRCGGRPDPDGRDRPAAGRWGRVRRGAPAGPPRGRVAWAPAYRPPQAGPTTGPYLSLSSVLIVFGGLGTAPRRRGDYAGGHGRRFAGRNARPGCPAAGRSCAGADLTRAGSRACFRCSCSCFRRVCFRLWRAGDRGDAVAVRGGAARAARRRP